MLSPCSMRMGPINSTLACPAAKDMPQHQFSWHTEGRNKAVPTILPRVPLAEEGILSHRNSEL